jgi:ribulose-5-phosphate 4-epimerase/fuculose-1-phosphate aldolase
MGGAGVNERELREALCEYGYSLFERGFVVGSSGNMSVRFEDGMLLSPTNSCLGRLDPDRISKVAGDGTHVCGDRPTKEAFLHKAIYEERPGANAVVHVHSTCATAVACLGDVDPENVLPALTPPQTVYVGTLPLVPYFAPGCRELAEAVRARAKTHHAMLLANHGPVVSGATLEAAANAAEELEEAARMFLLLKGHAVRPLTRPEIEELERARKA